MKNIVIRLIRIITGRCPNCGKYLFCANNNDFEYGLWYCPNCDGELKNDFIKDNKLVNSNSGNERVNKRINEVNDKEGVSESANVGVSEN